MNEGVALAQQQRYLDAITKLEQAGAIDPTNDQAFANLAMVHMEMRDFGKARDALQRAIIANGHSALYHEGSGTRRPYHEGSGTRRPGLTPGGRA